MKTKTITLFELFNITREELWKIESRRKNYDIGAISTVDTITLLSMKSQ